MDLNTVIFMDLTGKQLLQIGAGVFVVAILVPAILRFFSGSDKSAPTRTVRCSCGWSGQISRVAGRCPKCNTPIR